MKRVKKDTHTQKEVKSNDEDTKVMMSDPGPKRSVAIMERGRRGVSELKG